MTESELHGKRTEHAINAICMDLFPYTSEERARERNTQRIHTHISTATDRFHFVSLFKRSNAHECVSRGRHCAQIVKQWFSYVCTINAKLQNEHMKQINTQQQQQRRRRQQQRQARAREAKTECIKLRIETMKHSYRIR